MAAKQLGFSVEELRRLTVAEVLDFADAAWPEPQGEPQGAVRRRPATQDDIDRFASAC